MKLQELNIQNKEKEQLALRLDSYHEYETNLEQTVSQLTENIVNLENQMNGIQPVVNNLESSKKVRMQELYAAQNVSIKERSHLENIDKQVDKIVEQKQELKLFKKSSI